MPENAFAMQVQGEQYLNDTNPHGSSIEIKFRQAIRKTMITRVFLALTMDVPLVNTPF